ncbi:MAG TPA: hypothetical protein VKB49_19775 [Candidatus Sulfotelmatobacter sp.]|nr:hypothetical protein [Candidatus Sulfotelmatobacter sp.]
MTQVLPKPKQIHADWGRFAILKKHDGVGMMGGCTTCGRKFFTPSEYFQDALGAEDYLRGKFGDHDCQRGSPQF